MARPGHGAHRRAGLPGPRAGLLLAVILPVWCLVFGPVPAWSHGERFPRRHILDALRFVETSNMADPPDGDDGRAIGPYQIHRAYWQDAVEFRPGLGGDYQQCREREYAEAVIDAYMSRYAPRAWRLGLAEVIARIHNGGPDGARQDVTLPYWKKVHTHLTSE